MLGEGLPSAVGKSHMLRQKGGVGIQNTSYFPHHLIPTALLLPHGSSLFTLELLSSGWVCDPQTAAPASDAARRTGRDTCIFSLLWKEAEGREGGSWVPEPQALVLASNPWTLLTCGL